MGFDEEDSRMAKVAEFVNKYPNIELSYEFDKDQAMVVDQRATINVTVDREVDEDQEGIVDTTVNAQFYPFSKTENCKYNSLITSRNCTNMLSPFFLFRVVGCWRL